MHIVRNTHIRSMQPLITANQLLKDMPASPEIYEHIVRSRAAFSDCLHGRDNRFVVIEGPCSYHDFDAFIEMARQAALLQRECPNLLIFLRAFFEKPRTGDEWEGYLNDPHLDGSCDIQTGIIGTRQVLLEVAKLGVPVATEFIDPNLVNYIADLISWNAIGARHAASTIHARLASGLSMPVGGKNSTAGEIEPVIGTMIKASRPRYFVDSNDDGRSCVIETTGNPDVHLILRGGSSGPNYDVDSVKQAEEMLKEAGLPSKLASDCSHAQSDKDYRKQRIVAESIAKQRKDGNSPIFCAMLETNLIEGKQPIGPRNTLVYGQSITDGCIGSQETKELLYMLNESNA